VKTSPLSPLGRRTQPPPISWLMRMTLERPGLISLAAGFTDNPSLPVREARALFQDLLRDGPAGQAALQYGSTPGLPQLRELTARRLCELDGPGAAAPGRLIISSGSQQMLYMVTEALCGPGDIVLVEDPTYFVYLGILQSHGVETRGIRMEADGLSLEHLEDTLNALSRDGDLPRVKLLYLVSYFQNPTGLTTRREKKSRAIEILRRYERRAGHPIYLVEDAAYRELRFSGLDEPSALALRRHASRVIYVGTYSKPFATGARVGFGVLPEPVFTTVERIKGNHDFGTSNVLQCLLASALESGHYDRHLAILRRRYRHKAETMTAAARRHFSASVQWREPQGGLYLWAALPGGVSAGVNSRVFRAALERGVLYVPGQLCYAPDPRRRRPAHELRLSFGGATTDQITRGMARLGGVLRAMV